MAVVHVAITVDSGEPMRVMEFQCGPMSSPDLPEGAVWDLANPGYWLREPTDKNIASEVAKSCPPFGYDGDIVVVLPKVLSWRRIDKTDLPTSRQFRDAWVDTFSAIDHDMVKARAIHVERLRGDRAKAFVELDAEWMKAIGQKDQATADVIEAQRQVLRDITVDPRIVSAQTVGDLALVAVSADEVIVAK